MTGTSRSKVRSGSPDWYKTYLPIQN